MSLCLTNKGSILIEALAAVAIIGVSLTLIMESFAGNFRATVLHQEYAKAVILLENQLDAALAQDAKDAVKADDLCSSAVPYTCQGDVEPLSDPQSDGLKRLEVTVDWPSGRRRRSVSASTYLRTPDVKQETKSVFYN